MFFYLNRKLRWTCWISCCTSKFGRFTLLHWCYHWPMILMFKKLTSFTGRKKTLMRWKDWLWNALDEVVQMLLMILPWKFSANQQLLLTQIKPNLMYDEDDYWIAQTDSKLSIYFRLIWDSLILSHVYVSRKRWKVHTKFWWNNVNGKKWPHERRGIDDRVLHTYVHTDTFVS
jgi:hypothetical protein